MDNAVDGSFLCIESLVAQAHTWHGRSTVGLGAGRYGAKFGAKITVEIEKRQK